MIINLSSISSGFEFWSVNRTSMSENSWLKVFKNVTASGETSNNWPNDLLRTNSLTLLMLLNFADNVTLD